MRKFSEAIDSLKNGDVDWKEKVGSVTAAAGAKLGQAREAAKAGLEAAKASENGQKFLEATAAAGQRVGQARAAAGHEVGHRQRPQRQRRPRVKDGVVRHELRAGTERLVGTARVGA